MREGDSAVAAAGEDDVDAALAFLVQAGTRIISSKPDKSPNGLTVSIACRALRRPGSHRRGV